MTGGARTKLVASVAVVSLAAVACGKDSSSSEADARIGIDGNHAGPAPTLADVDLTLGGLEQDLPPPAVDCTREQTPISGCISWTGEYNGAPVHGGCGDVATAITYPGTQRVSVCSVPLAANDSFDVVLGIGSASWGSPPPRAFTMSSPPVPDPTVGRLELSRDARGFTTQNHSFSSETPDYTWRVAGVTGVVPGNPNSPSQKNSEIAMGAFAGIFRPKPGCTPDGSIYGCDSVRVRGTFNVRALLNWDVAGP